MPELLWFRRELIEYGERLVADVTRNPKHASSAFDNSSYYTLTKSGLIG